MDLKGKHIVITGGQRVGQFVARELLEAGARVSMSYLKEQSEAAQGVGAFQMDVASEKSIRRFLEQASGVAEVDGLVNMVSVFLKEPEIVDYEYFEKVFLVNAFGNMLMARLMVEYAQGRGKKNVPIVSFVDWAVDHPYRGYDAYLAAKAALRHYLMALQTSFAGVVRVVNIHPGMILEPPGFSKKEKSLIEENTPVKAIGNPGQAAKLVKVALELDYLAENVHLDGGQHWRHRLV